MGVLQKAEMALGCAKLVNVLERFWIHARGRVSRDCFNFLLKSQLEMLWKVARQQGDPALLDEFAAICKQGGRQKTARRNGNRTRRAHRILGRKAAAVAAVRKRQRILSR